MRFVITSRPKFPVPPEVLPMLAGAMRQWVAEHTKSGQLEQVWGTPSAAVAAASSP